MSTEKKAPPRYRITAKPRDGGPPIELFAVWAGKYPDSYSLSQAKGRTKDGADRPTPVKLKMSDGTILDLSTLWLNMEPVRPPRELATQTSLNDPPDDDSDVPF